MNDFLIANEAPLRLAAFIGVLAFFVVLEALLPRRQRTMTRRARWSANLSVSIINTMILRFVVPVLAVTVAIWANANGIGLFNLTPLPWIAEFVLALLLLDALIWAQHVLMHKVPVLWRMHRMHHTDRDLDATTALRFHPFEIVVSMAIKIIAVALLGPPLAAVIMFEVVLNAMATFNHSNLRLPARLDGALRLVVVTPDMHRVHHSVHQDETNSNFGFNLSLWDRVFGTYRAAPRDGHTAMELGIPETRDAPVANLLWLMASPFWRPKRTTEDIPQ